MTSLEGDLIRERFGQASLPSVVSRAYLAWSLAARGEFAEAIAQGEEGIRIAQGVDHLVSQVSAHLGMSSLHLAKGDLDKAIPVLEHSLALCQGGHIQIAFPHASALGSAYSLSGRVTQALPLLEQAASMRRMVEQSLRVTWLGEAYLLAGRTDEAI